MLLWVLLLMIRLKLCCVIAVRIKVWLGISIWQLLLQILQFSNGIIFFLFLPHMLSFGHLPTWFHPLLLTYPEGSLLLLVLLILMDFISSIVNIVDVYLLLAFICVKISIAWILLQFFNYELLLLSLRIFNVTVIFILFLIVLVFCGS